MHKGNTAILRIAMSKRHTSDILSCPTTSCRHSVHETGWHESSICRSSLAHNQAWQRIRDHSGTYGVAIMVIAKSHKYM